MQHTFISAPSPFPDHLRNELPYPSAPWTLSREVEERIEAFPPVQGKRYKILELRPDDPEALFVQKYFLQNPPPGKGIRRIEVIDTPHLTSRFETELLNCEEEYDKFNEDWSQEPDAAHRDFVFEDWRRLTDQFTPLQIATLNTIEEILKARILPLWHGTSEAVSLSVAESGFQFFGKHHLDKKKKSFGGKFKSTDPGYFGSGIYFTDSSSYACRYAQLQSDNVLLLSFAAMRKPFPIVSNVAHPKRCFDMERFMGDELYQSYNAHFVPVAPIAAGSMQYFPCRYEKPQCHEIVIKTPSQALARYRVTVGSIAPFFQAISTIGRNGLKLPKKGSGEGIGMKLLLDAMRGHYARISTNIPLPMSDETLPLKYLFSDLVIVNSKTYAEKEQQLLLPENDSYTEALKSLSSPHASIALNELFSELGDPQTPKKVLITGRAGSGKTTLVDRLTLGWTDGEVMSQFDMLIRLPLRELNQLDESTLPPNATPHEWLAFAASHVIFHHRSHHEDLLHCLKLPKNRILILLDGLDEASNSLIQRILSLLDVNGFHFLITSRPGVPLSVLQKIDRKVENIGFSSEQIENYALKFFHRKEQPSADAIAFLQAIQNQRFLYAIAHTPLNLQILCNLWEHNSDGFNFNETMTSLYQEIIQQLFLWNYKKTHPQIDAQDAVLDEGLINALGSVALNGLTSGKLLITPTLMSKALSNTGFRPEALIKTGLIKNQGNAYVFFHLTIQEYLIAVHLFHQGEKAWHKFVHEHRYDPKYALTLSFLAGHIFNHDNSMEKEKIKGFFKILNGSPFDLAGYSHIELINRCALECPDEEFRDWLEGECHLEDSLLAILRHYLVGASSFGDLPLQRLASLLNYRSLPVSEDPITKEVLSCIENKQGQELVRALHACEIICTTWTKSPKRFVSKLIALLDHRDADVANAAEKTLKKISSTITPTKHDIRELVKLLEHNQEHQRRVAAKSLASLCRASSSQKILKKLAESCSSNNQKVVEAALDALALIPQQFSDELIRQLELLLEDKSDAIKAGATLALISQADLRPLEPRCILKIISLLANENRDIREAATTLFRSSSSVAFPGEVTNMLVSFLDNERVEVKAAAIEALGNLAASSPLQNVEIISRFLHADAEEVKLAALEALSKMRNSQFSEDILLKIAALQNDKNRRISAAAANACVAICAAPIQRESVEKAQEQLVNCQVAALTENKVLSKILSHSPLNFFVIPKIVPLLDHHQKAMRENALSMLGSITNEPLSEEILIKIASLLEDREWAVRIAALEAFANISMRQELPESVIDKMTSKLNDLESSVRVRAAKALGTIAAKTSLKQSAIIQLVKTLKTEDMILFSVVCQTLKGIANKLSDEQVMTIAKYIRRIDVSALKDVIALIGKISQFKQPGNDVLLHLLSMQHAPNRDINRSATQAIGSIPLKRWAKAFSIADPEESHQFAACLMNQAFLTGTAVIIIEHKNQFYLNIGPKLLPQAKQLILTEQQKEILLSHKNSLILFKTK